MSTKVYNGMVIPLDKLGEFISIFYNKSIQKARKNIMDFCKQLDATKTLEILKSKYGISCSLEYAPFMFIIKEMIDSSRTSESWGNYDMWFNAWVIKNKVYLYAPCDRTAPSSKDFPSWCRNFSYWDNTDPDSKVSDREWKNREKIWNDIFDKKDIHLQKISFVAIEAKNLMHGGILDLFPNIEQGQLFEIHSTAFFCDKKI